MSFLPRLLTRAAIVALLSASSPALALDLPTPTSGSAIAAMSAASDAKGWDDAEALVAQLRDPTATDLALWMRLRGDNPSWPALYDFLTRHPDWPGTSRLRRTAEGVMPAGLPAAETIAFFAPEAPATGTGALALARALLAAGRGAAADAEALRAWTTLSMTSAEEDAFLSAFPRTLAAAHWARLDMLLWQGIEGQAARAAARMGKAEQALATARSGLRANNKGVNTLIDAIPASRADDAGLAWERFNWRTSRGLGDGAEELLLERSTSAAALGRPEAWADRRRSMARQAQRDGRIDTAYRIASRHHLTEGSDYADLEWLSGWLALRFMNDPARALAHFQRLEAAVATPISLGRAGYWIGRALEASGDAKGARTAYIRGARHQTSFYGQLAAEKLGGAPDDVLAAAYPIARMPEREFGPPDVLRAALLLNAAEERGLSHWFFTHLAQRAKGETEFAALAGLALKIDRPEIAVRIAKIAAESGSILPAAYHPLTELAQMQGPVPKALALAIARQESEMNSQAISPAGARGLMQLMPGTAKLVAGKLDLPYGFARLTEDWRYNATLGQEYLSWLIRDFGALPLAAAGYNAGPNRVRSWLERYGDPRGRGTEVMIDWIETIPFNETRNYAQRVMEGLHVYETRLSGEAAPVTLSARLGG
ncbi:MAG: soluble lytic murein transglycosylase [Paracoccaceae bacterium]|jgi:soluble lytic murein transglycosylase